MGRNNNNNDMNSFMASAGHSQSTPMMDPMPNRHVEKTKPIDTSALRNVLDEQKRQKEFDKKQKTVNPKMWHG